MSQTKTITDANFQQSVLEYDQPVLVDFWAAWCGPCRAVGPTIEELAVQYGESVKVGKLNVNENPQSARRFGIQSIPTVLVFKDGRVAETLVGVQSKQRYEEAVRNIAA
jgi:thioredoxin 1